MTPAFSFGGDRANAGQSRFFPLQLDTSRYRHTFNGSAALYQAGLLAGLKAEDTVLLPAYCCGAELGPFQQLGCKLAFYDVNEQLIAEHSTIKQALDLIPDIKLVMVTHYLGLPQPHTGQIARLCKAHNVVLLEDCAHALFCSLDGVPLGSFGDYAIFSPRKSLPMIEGGIVCSGHEIGNLPTRSFRELPRIAWLDRLCYSIQRGLRSQQVSGYDYLQTRMLIAFWALPAFAIKLIKRSTVLASNTWLSPDVEGNDAVPVYCLEPSTLSLKVLDASDAAAIASNRRDNHALWHSSVAGCQRIRPIRDNWPEGCCPLYFVVQVPNPQKTVESLELLDIEAFNWWQHLPDEIDWQVFPVAKRLKQSLLALPVHQQLTQDQIVRMAGYLIQIVEADEPDSKK